MSSTASSNPIVPGQRTASARRSACATGWGRRAGSWRCKLAFDGAHSSAGRSKHACPPPAQVRFGGRTPARRRPLLREVAKRLRAPTMTLHGAIRRTERGRKARPPTPRNDTPAQGVRQTGDSSTALLTIGDPTSHMQPALPTDPSDEELARDGCPGELPSRLSTGSPGPESRLRGRFCSSFQCCKSSCNTASPPPPPSVVPMRRVGDSPGPHQGTYADMARHFGTVIVPARPKKPRDKAKVEVGAPDCPALDSGSAAQSDLLLARVAQCENRRIARRP